MIVELKRPIQAHGEERKAIDLREPTGADIIACGGHPAVGLQNDAGTTSLTVNAAIIAAYLSRLGNVPPSSVQQLSPTDWMRCQRAVMNFFNEPEEEPAMESSTDTSILRGSGNGARTRSSNSPSAN